MIAAAKSARATIGYLIAVFPGLTETFIAREIEALKSRGFEIVVFAIKRPDPVPPPALSSDETLRDCVYARPDRLVRHFAVNLQALVIHPVRYIATLRAMASGWTALEPRTFVRLLYHFAVGVGFAGEMRRRGITHLHCHFSSGCNIALAAHLYAGISFSFTAHASDDLFVRPVHLPLKLRYASLVIAVSEYSRRYLDSVTGYVYSHKLHRVFNGVDLGEAARLAPLPGEHPAGNGDAGTSRPLRVLSVGNGAGVKGFATLIEACTQLRAAGCPVECTIIGEGPDSTLLTRRFGAALNGAVRLLGPRPLCDVYRAMRDADVFVLLSEIGIDGHRDGFPTVLLEAMAMSLPVVATWVSGIPEIVEHQVTGILVPERTPAAAAAALQRLHCDPALRARMGAAAEERVRRLFALDHSADEVARLLSDMLAGR